MIDHPSRELSLKAQAALLGLSRSSLYYEPLPPSDEEIAVKHRIDELYTRYPFYGSRRMTVMLNQEHIVISRPTVQRYMREMGISGIAPGPNTSKLAPEHKIYPYLLRNVQAEAPDQIWGIDITYIRLIGGWMYLVAVLDWYHLGAGSKLGDTFCPGCSGPCFRSGSTHHLEQRSGEPLH